MQSLSQVVVQMMSLSGEEENGTRVNSEVAVGTHQALTLHSMSNKQWQPGSVRIYAYPTGWPSILFESEGWLVRKHTKEMTTLAGG